MKTIETLNPSPFRHLISTIGELPTSFTESMSYYELLAWLCDFLEKKVLPTVNTNAEALKELQDYVVNYFDNLDVQEEINNKLDDMAESGQLSAIIAEYLELKGVLAFDTPAEVKTADNLIAGSFVKTYGYKRKGDGVCDLYTVRNVQIGDVEDGYNVISLTEDPGLVAIRLQEGGKRLIKLEPTDNIQDYLDLECEKEIVFPAGTTTVTDALLLNSDTTINLNGGTLNFDFDRSEIFDYDWDETLGFMSYKPEDEFTGYNGNKNITIKNGSITGGCSCFLHSENVTFDNVSFETEGCRHSLQIGACKNVVIENCEFNGTRDEDVSLASECINIDSCVYGSQPYISEYSAMWDDTGNTNITIKSNVFKQPTNASLAYKTAIGTHNGDEYGYTICSGLYIIDNTLGDPDESCINTKNYVNVGISANSVYYASDIEYGHFFILKRGYLRDAEIHDNNLSGISLFLFSGSPCQDGTRLNISSNRVKAFDLSSDTYGLFQLFNIHDSNISGNSFIVRHRAFHINTRNYRDSDVTDIEADHTNNLTINDNSIEKTENTASYLGNRISTCKDVKILNNTFLHRGTVQSDYVLFYFQGTQTNICVDSNTTDQPKKFCATNKVTSGFVNNNAIYSQSDTISSSNTSGNLDQDVRYFSTIILSVGETVNTQVLTLKPYLPSGEKFDTENRTFKIPVTKNDGTYGIATFTYANDGKAWTYVGDLPLRHIWTQD